MSETVASSRRLIVKIGSALLVDESTGEIRRPWLEGRIGRDILELDRHIADQDGYAKDFLPKAQASIKESGGKYLAGGFNKAISLSGSPPPNRVVLLEFADMDALKAFEAKESQLETDLGNKYASFRAVGIEGVAQK